MLIKELLNQFLSDQQARLARKAYRDYSVVMGLFADHLDSDGWNYLDDGDNAYFEAVEQEKTFIDLYDHSHIEDNIEAFLNDFVPQKVVAEDAFIFETCPRVMRTLLTWMRDQHLVELTNADIQEMCEN
jgi:hypothetical protein